MRPIERAYGQFLPEFLGAIFAPGDRVRVAVLHGPGDMRNERMLRDAAVRRMQQLHATPNLYFACAALNDAEGYGKRNCVSTRAVCLDLDYGTAGHRASTFFDTMQDAWACLMTAPVTPSCVWHTGHGLQALYLLDTPYVFRDSDPDARIAAYEAVSRKMAMMVQSDATFTPEHLFRVPMTVNAKPDTPPVQGQLLWWEPGRRYAFTQLQMLCEAYDVPDDEPTPSVLPASRSGTAYAELPQDLRTEIEMHHSDRSGAMFTVVLHMIQEGYAADVVHDAVGRGPSFRQKYGNRLSNEIDRCIEKIHAAPHVYADVRMPMDVVNAADEISLEACSPLPSDMDAMLTRYSAVSGIALSDRVRQAARFHEHLFSTHQSGVMETPCGYGKSTWALCHIALHATAGKQYLYVVDTIDALYRAAGTIEALTPNLSVGRYHAFNAKQCTDLCGVEHSWQECSASDPASACRSCTARTRCPFFNRDRELDKPVVVMSHNGFVRLLESEAAEPMLVAARILVDEDLNAFLSAEFTHADLQLVEAYVQSIGMSVKPFFPYTSFAASGTALGIEPGFPTYASMHYVYRDERDTGALAGTVTELRRALGTGRLDPIRTTAADAEHARQVLSELLTFFRAGYRGDSRYALREIGKPDAVQYLVKKSRFNLGSQPPGEKLWILNASAQLSPYPYPANMPVYQCVDLQPHGHRVSMHVIAGNPMQSKHAPHVDTACRIIRQICLDRQHTDVFVATDKGAKETDDMAAAVRDSFGVATRIVHMERGRIRGSNEAGSCTFACLAGLSLFTSIDNVGATAAILSRRTIPVTPHVFSKSGAPSMPGGRFRLRIMREIYALSALDELYQTLWRTAVRNDGQVEAIVVVPDAEWLSILWRTVMPGYRTHAVHKPHAAGFKIDLAMDGVVFLMGVEPGREFDKQQVAKLLGYKGVNPWKENQNRIRYLLDPFFEEGSTVHKLRRKAGP